MSTYKTNGQYEVLGPWAEADPIPLRGLIAPRLIDLTGKKIGLLCNAKRAAKPISTVVEKKLKEKFPTAEFSQYYTLNAVGPPEIETENKAKFEEWISRVDMVITAVGDWGACTKYLVYEAISIEERNKPVVALIYQDFINDARSAASSRGMPGVRTVKETIPSEWTDMDDIEAGVTAVIDDIIAGLTRPLTEEDKSPKREVEKPSRIVFKGNLEEVNRFFYRRGWADGLPIIPPTEEAVAEMLTGTDLPPDHLIAKLEPRLGKATVEKIAINAVMAGALPTYMPLLIAGVQAMMDPQIGPTGLAVSTHSFAPFWIINGPIRKDLHINHSYGTLSPGDIANATIGRSMGLITKNIRGVRKGIEDMGVLGNPGRWSMVIAENEEDSPWEPLHVEHGFSREDSTISLSFSSSFQQILPNGTDDKSILNTVIHNVIPGQGGTFFIIITPTLAKPLGNKGWTKQDIKDFTMVRPSPRLTDPIQILVAGGTGTRLGILSGSPRPSVTQKAELPAKWDKLVAKYKNIIPTYAMY